MDGFLLQATIYLAAAVITVPIAKRIGLGSVLGYLIAGVIIGPVTGLVGNETKDLQHFAEFGVVMMLFIVGLELEPRALWGYATPPNWVGGIAGFCDHLGDYGRVYAVWAGLVCCFGHWSDVRVVVHRDCGSDVEREKPDANPRRAICVFGFADARYCSDPNVGFGGRAQLIDATHWANFSAGV